MLDLQLMRGRGRGGCKENDFNFRYANLMNSLSKIRMQTKGTAVAAHRGGDRIEMGKGTIF